MKAPVVVFVGAWRCLGVGNDGGEPSSGDGDGDGTGHGGVQKSTGCGVMVGCRHLKLFLFTVSSFLIASEVFGLDGLAERGRLIRSG
jgi:hypothetical protein